MLVRNSHPCCWRRLLFVNRVLRIVLLLIFVACSFAQTSQPVDLTALEKHVAKHFNELREDSGLKPLKVRRDRRMRMEACSVQIKRPDPIVDIAQQKRRFWYLTADPKKPSDELARLASAKTSDDHVGVGVWFATTEDHPSGMYWVVVYPEHSPAHEAFWSHFYLTDDFEYQTPFGKQWKQGLPQQCRSIQ